MKLSRLASILPLVLLGAGCGSPTDPSTEPVSFSHSVSFGFCLPTAYCSSRLELTEREAVMTYESRQRAPFVQRRALEASQWAKVSQALDARALRALPDVVGCPDCADGGAEAVAVAFEDGPPEAVTFEYNRDLPEIQALVDALREVRRTFAPPPSPES